MGQRPLFGFPLALMSAVWVASAQGAEYALEPSISMRGEYSDNIRLTTAPHQSVWGASLQPRLTGRYATDTTELSGTGGLNLRRYSRESELNATDVLLNLRGAQRYLTGRVGLGVDYVRDSTLVSELEETGLVLTRKQRDRFNLRPDWTWQITRRTALSLGYQYTDVSYEDVGQAGLVDYHSHTFSSALRHDLSPRDQVSGTLAHQQYRPSGTARDVDVTTLLAGYSHLFSATLRGSASIGLADINSRGSPAGDTRSNRVLGSLTLENQLQAGQIAARLGREVGPTGLGGIVEIDRAAIEWFDRFTQTLSFRIAGATYRTRFLDQQQVGGSKYYQVEPRLTWQATRDWALEAGYRHQWRKRESDPMSADANTVYVSAIYNWPRRPRPK